MNKVDIRYFHSSLFFFLHSIWLPSVVFGGCISRLNLSHLNSNAHTRIMQNMHAFWDASEKCVCDWAKWDQVDEMAHNIYIWFYFPYYYYHCCSFIVLCILLLLYHHRHPHYYYYSWFDLRYTYIHINREKNEGSHCCCIMIIYINIMQRA